MNRGLEMLLTSAPLIIGSVSLILIFLVQYGILQKTVTKKVVLVLLLIVTLLSLFPFAHIIFSAPTTMIYPISLGIILINAKSKFSDIFLTGVLYVHICYWVFVIILYTSNANTWGNIQGLIGCVSAPNSILFINFFLLLVERRKWVAIFKMFAGIVAVILIYQWTNGLESGEFSVDDVRFARISAIILCLFSIIEGVILLKRRREFNHSNLSI